MNILWVLSLAYLAMVVKAQFEEVFKITAGKRIKQGGSHGPSPPTYQNYRSGLGDPHFGANYGVNPAYLPVVYGTPPTLQYLPENGPIYSGYPLEQGPQQLYPQPVVSGYEQNYGRNGAPAGQGMGDNYYGAGGTPSNADQIRNLPNFLSTAFIDSINETQDLWTAVDNFEDAPHIYDYVQDICGVRDPAVGMPNLLAPVSYNIKDIPAQFDARAYAPWAMCESLHEVRDQGSCGSCWAIAAVECMTDRICIASKGKQEFHISTQDLLECCTSCGYGCDGGFPGIAWTYFKETGIVTGGEFNATGKDKGCKPYEIEPCAHHTKRSTKKRCSAGSKTPTCERSCDSGEPYNENLHFGDLAYSIDKKVESIQLEIMNYGPVQASYEVYEDFLSYGDGVYFHVNGSKVGDHAVKLIGWGTQNKTNYWLCVNSWGKDWGSLGGFFKVKRGSDECRIESNVVAGKPKVASNFLFPSEPQPRTDVINKRTPFVNGNIPPPPGNKYIRTPLVADEDGGVPFAKDNDQQSPLLLDGGVQIPFANRNIGTPFTNGNLETPFANG